MRKLIVLLLTLLPCLALTAQEADIRRLAEHYAEGVIASLKELKANTTFASMMPVIAGPTIGL